MISPTTYRATVSNLPEEFRKQLKTHLSKMTDQSIDTVVNLTGKYIDKKKREVLKEKAQVEIGTQIEETITKAYRMGLKLREKHLQGKLADADSLKEKFYVITDTVFQSIFPDIPVNVHAMDYLFQFCDELLKSFRFDCPYLRDTNYVEYLKGLEELINKLQKEQKIGKAWQVLNEFKNSTDFFPLLQATLQRLIKHYQFLEKDFSEIKKRQIDRYLEIYEEIAGHYEKLISLLAALIKLSLKKTDYSYYAARKRGLSWNVSYVENSGWGIFTSGYNRNIRNAIAHKTWQLDIMKQKVDFIDRNETVTLTFKDVQKETRELAALILVLPHVLVSIFCSAVLSIKDVLNSLLDQKTKEPRISSKKLET